VPDDLLSLLHNDSGTDQILLFPKIFDLISYCNPYLLIDCFYRQRFIFLATAKLMISFRQVMKDILYFPLLSAKIMTISMKVPILV